ncbi:MAG: hypothetical protein MMC33_006070 [Icmadophila ericetorum]|nr:hypothetical protein [Icmadophila ericetorum]
MATIQDKPKRWSRGIFRSKAAAKISIFEDPVELPDGGVRSPLDETLSSGSYSPDSDQKSGPTRFQRSGSKILSALGIRNSNVRYGKGTSSTLNERDTPATMYTPTPLPIIASEERAAAPHQPSPLGISDKTVDRVIARKKVSTVGKIVKKKERANQGDKEPTLDPKSKLRVETPMIIYSTVARDAIACPNPCKLLSPPINVASRDSGDARIVDLEVSTGEKDLVCLRHSISMPGIAHQLSHKLSTTFGNPTVIHRPNLHIRVSLTSIRPDLTVEIPAFSPTVDTDVSSVYNDSASPTAKSTAKTSLESIRSSLVSCKNKDRGEKVTVQVNRHAVIPEEPQATFFTSSQVVEKLPKPTMRTVEITASAKIFFETHFNSIYCGQPTSRTLRRYELQKMLQAEALSPQQCQQELNALASLESDYLRQSRVLKARSQKMIGDTRNDGVSIAGYEVVRILGKGSFGVVRLVREEEKPVSSIDEKQCQQSGVAATALDSLRTTWDNRNIFPRRMSSKKAPREVFAMKVIRKSDMLRNGQEGHLRAERDFLVASEKSRWIVPLIASFQDNTNLYLVMEYMIGGDFLGLLIRRERLRERVTKFYIAEMILCVEEAHKLRWIHRDIKPDNFLITASGHLKISDFGLAFDGHWSHDQSYFNNHRQSLMEKLGITVQGDFLDRQESAKNLIAGKITSMMGGSKAHKGQSRHEMPLKDRSSESSGVLHWRDRHGKRKLAASIVGTSQYMAPEVIRGDLYDGRCDWWSVGIIMYECLYGNTPFIDEDRLKTKQKVLRHGTELRFPHAADLPKKYRVSTEAKECIDAVLQEKEHRLCSKKYQINDYEQMRGASRKPAVDNVRDYLGFFVYPNDAADIKAHKFFDGTDWETLHLQRPPYVPQVKKNDDTTYFDEDEPLSDVDDAPSDISIQEDDLRAQEAFEDAVAAEYAAKEARGAEQAGQYLDGTAYAQPTTQKPHDIFGATLVNTSQKTVVAAPPKAPRKGAKEKKRPRDRVLRDRTVAKEVMDLRKKGAFLGYTYRRPRGVMVGLELRKAGWGSLGKMMANETRADGLEPEALPFRAGRQRGRISFA